MMNQLTLACLFAFLFGCTGSAQAQRPDSVSRYLDTALHLMQERSLYAGDLDWDTIRDSVYARAAGATTYSAAFPALVYAFDQLRDDHGMVANTDTFYRFPPAVDLSARNSEGIRREYLRGNRIVTAVLPGEVPYLRVPSMQGVQPDVVTRKANALRDSLCRLLGPGRRELVLDLRMNNGGNSLPMLAGVAPLFDRAVLGYGIGREGQVLDSTVLVGGVPAWEGTPPLEVTSSCAADPRLRIAVLLGPCTASSGEIMALFLRAQANVRTFGEETAGFCNATEGFLFNDRQGYLLLSTNWIADSRGRVCREERLTPDAYIDNENDNFEQPAEDPTVRAALAWLRGG